MSRENPNAISRVRVRHFLVDAQTIQAQYQRMTSHHRGAAELINQLIQEIASQTDVENRIGEASEYVRERIVALIAIMDGDFSINPTERMSASQLLLEPVSAYAIGVQEAASATSAPWSKRSPSTGEAAETSLRKRIRNPPWQREEIVLATEVYIRSDGQVLGPRDRLVVELSTLLNRLPIIPIELRNKKFRNPEGVGLKLSNIRAADPDRPGGSPHGNKLDGLFWDEFYADEQLLFAEARRIRNRYPL